MADIKEQLEKEQADNAVLKAKIEDYETQIIELGSKLEKVEEENELLKDKLNDVKDGKKPLPKVKLKAEGIEEGTYQATRPKLQVPDKSVKGKVIVMSAEEICGKKELCISLVKRGSTFLKKVESKN